MTKTIPAVIIFICDRCALENPSRRSGAKLTLSGAALDWQGCAVADGTQSWELCDQCAFDVGKLILGYIQTKQEKQP